MFLIAGESDQVFDTGRTAHLGFFPFLKAGRVLACMEACASILTMFVEIQNYNTCTQWMFLLNQYNTVFYVSVGP